MENSLKSMVFQALRPAIVLFVLLSVITGITYPLITTGIGQLLLPAQKFRPVLLTASLPVALKV